MSKFADTMTGAGGLLSMIPGAQPFALGAMGLGFLGNMFKSPDAVDRNVYRPNFQFGGVMGDVERDEVVQTPDGQMVEIGGGTHASGNDTTIMAPEGTAVYSDSISIDGKTMAERKKSRERRMNKLQKEAAKIAEDMEENATDAISRQSNERVLGQILADYIKEQMEEETDMQVQQIVGQAEEASEMPMGESMGEEMPMMKYGGKMKKNYGGKMKKYGSGGFMGVNSVMSNPNLRGAILDPILGQANQAVDIARQFGNVGQGNTPTPSSLHRGSGQVTPDNPLDLARRADSPSVVAKQLNPLFDDTPYTPSGDSVTSGSGAGSDLNPWSEAGSLANIFAPTAITLAQRLGDRRNPNYFEGFGAEGLRTQGRAFGAAAGQRDAALGDVSRATAAQRQRTQQGARGINTMRAMDSATFGQAGRQRQDIRNQYTQHIANLFRERAGMQNQIDQVRMGGAAQADIADRQDRASFHSNLAKSVMQGGREAQHYGKMQDMAKAIAEGRMNEFMANILTGLTVPGQ